MKTPCIGYHHDLVVFEEGIDDLINYLPEDLANALSAVWNDRGQRRNPLK